MATDSLMYLPLADATVITFLSPCISCFACSFLIDQPFTRMEQIAALISFVGVVLIARPSALFPSSNSSSPPASDGGGEGSPPFSSLLQMNSQPSSPSDATPAQRAVGVGIALMGKRAHPLLSVNYFALTCTVVSTFVLLFVPGIDFMLPANWKEWGLLIALGVFGFVMVIHPFCKLLRH